MRCTANFPPGQDTIFMTSIYPVSLFISGKDPEIPALADRRNIREFIKPHRSNEKKMVIYGPLRN